VAGKNFLFSKAIKTGSGTHPAFYSIDIRALSRGVKQPYHEADHSSPPHAEIKNEWRSASLSLHAVMASTRKTLLY
jgi:hypothetical protein